VMRTGSAVEAGRMRRIRSAVQEIEGIGDRGAVLVRPDGHVAVISTEAGRPMVGIPFPAAPASGCTPSRCS
jgi:hypothetical protein